ncbi:hypothetical protein M758_10G033100 [Ceratodon purpureus]|uniref:Uncharacterized protein n=1 Tax=Ceratodon purpureus TaxID=3225 RepID=A0A8T0GLC3_CERPU|nr:hypothetical protein KC19_10G035700 [Ceratodon purpureus]KAG0602688.1 hypothetical protein M758_10G033100 [Ceratodon purpureus]
MGAVSMGASLVMIDMLGGEYSPVRRLPPLCRF